MKKGGKKRIEKGKHKLFLKQKLKKLLDICSFGTFCLSVEKVAALQINIDIFSTKNTLWYKKLSVTTTALSHWASLEGRGVVHSALLKAFGCWLSVSCYICSPRFSQQTKLSRKSPALCQVIYISHDWVNGAIHPHRDVSTSWIALVASVWKAHPSACSTNDTGLDVNSRELHFARSLLQGWHHFVAGVAASCPKQPAQVSRRWDEFWFLSLGCERRVGIKEPDVPPLNVC